jgi:glycosyltransferase involved in cell wall biosynthesis
MSIQVLMSTYNGEKYIAKQLESILLQTYQNISVLIRDDGSQDGTIRCIQEFSCRYPDKIQLIMGDNIGVKRSFFELLKNADSNCTYFSFCDQDDVWLEHKLLDTFTSMKLVENHQPIMYFTSTYLTDSQLSKLRIWPQSPQRSPSFYNALIENIAVGTTMTINSRARELLLSKKPDTDKLIMHDWWFYICISAFGNVIYNAKPSVLYRQHDGNLIGGNKTIFHLLLRKLRSYKVNKRKKLLHQQASEFMKCYGFELDSEKKLQLALFLSSREKVYSRLKYLYKCELYRQSVIENLLFKWLIAIGYI